LRNSKKGLINLQNDDNKCFLWCHIQHLNPAKKDPQTVKLTDKKFASKLDDPGVSFPVKLSDIPKNRKTKFNQY